MNLFSLPLIVLILTVDGKFFCFVQQANSYNRLTIKCQNRDTSQLFLTQFAPMIICALKLKFERLSYSIQYGRCYRFLVYCCFPKYSELLSLTSTTAPSKANRNLTTANSTSAEKRRLCKNEYDDIGFCTNGLDCDVSRGIVIGVCSKTAGSTTRYSRK